MYKAKETYVRSVTGLYASGYGHSQRGWAHNKVAGLRDYMFTVVIENVVDDCWYYRICSLTVECVLLL